LGQPLSPQRGQTGGSGWPFFETTEAAVVTTLQTVITIGLAIFVTVLFVHVTATVTSYSILAMSALWIGGACGYYLALADVGAEADRDGRQQ
jgi:hypothetical protein